MAKKAIRQIRIEGNVAYVPLTQGYEAIIDVDDVPAVSRWNWWAKRSYHGSSNYTFYAVRSSKVDGRHIKTSMHRALMSPGDAECVDHIDGNGLHNRRINLRLATQAENMRNTRKRSDNSSGAKGVYWHKSAGKWWSYITVNGKRRSLGLFGNFGDAEAAYATASMKLHGGYGRTG